MSDEHIKTAPAARAAAATDLAALTPLGRRLEENRTSARAAAWKKTLFAVLALLAGLNFFLRPAEPHFGPDAWPLFWPLFGLVTGLVMVWLVKKIIQPYLLKRPEDYYGDL
ncbi:MAG: hypothetical protein LBV21_04020 [Candidatus Adiutrix sp.]|jgi:fatty acid desaturase|nr:hypothetical protein [Candidatus Adiutrix sp.]